MAPEQTDKLISFGQMALEQGWYDQAREYFEQALELDASNREAIKGLAQIDEILREAAAVEPIEAEIQAEPSLGNRVSDKAESALEWIRKEREERARVVAERKGLAAEKREEQAREIAGRKEEQAELEQRKASLIVTTTYSVEGRAIIQYLDVVTAEVVLGTGFLSELDAGIADFFGTRAEGFQNKLQGLRQAALHELRNRAFQTGADAIVGVDFDYMTLGSNMLVVVANGTAVKLAPIESDTEIDNE